MDDLTLLDTLELAVNTEKIGQKFYQRLARKFADQKEVGEVFSQLAKDEEEHEEHFRNLLKSASSQESKSDRFELPSFLRATAISKFFKGDAFADVDQIETPADAMQRALAFEKTTLLFYIGIRDAVGPSTQLDALIEEEKKHVTALTRVLVADAKFRGLSDIW